MYYLKWQINGGGGGGLNTQEDQKEFQIFINRGGVIINGGSWNWSNDFT